MSFLITGKDYLSKFPDFKLVGRDDDLSRLCSVLIRSAANSIILSGIGGVGTSSLCLGIQALKDNPDTPFDIISKRLFWLDTNSLFSSGNQSEINTEFQKINKTLTHTSNSILIVEDYRDFLESMRNNGCTHFLNALCSGVRSKHYQIIFEAKDEDLDILYKSHSDLKELFTLLSLDEPNGDDLRQIIENSAASLSKFHKIRISDLAIDTAIDLTNKYHTRDAGLSRAQPERSITLLDRAFSSYRLSIHANPPGFSKDEWATNQNYLRLCYRKQRNGEELILELEEQIEEIKKKEASGGIDIPDSFKSFGAIDTKEVRDLRTKIVDAQKEVIANRYEFDALTTKVNDSLELTKDIVLQEFSKISGISVNKLNQNDLDKLKDLEPSLLKRIYGQDDAVHRLANAIKIARVGRRNKGRPQASFLFLGPSGVGKTELSKALAMHLLESDAALTRFDMSEYMEKHSVAKLIGAPPGYEGFEVGGILTNAMRKNSNRILLFDEIEKAHPDVFNIFLQILSDGRLTDNVGRTVSFEDTIIIMTTNIGQTGFLNTDLSWEESEDVAIAELNLTYRPEFLNRFAGRQNIVCFKRLGLDSIEKIVRREISNISQTYSEKGIIVTMDDLSLSNFCSNTYDPKIGARGLPGFIEANLEPIIVNCILDNPDLTGTANITYNSIEKTFNVDIQEDEK